MDVCSVRVQALQSSWLMHSGVFGCLRKRACGRTQASQRRAAPGAIHRFRPRKRWRAREESFAAGLRTVRCDDGWRLARSYFLHENLHLTGAGYGAKDIYAKGSGFTPKEMLAVGWEAKQLQHIGLTVEELHHAGFTTCAPGRSRTTPARPQRRLPPRTGFREAQPQ